MKARVKRVKRSVWYEENASYTHDHDVHAVRYTNTYAIAKWKGEKYYIDLDEDDIRNYYGRTRITRDLIEELSNDLYGEIIEFYEDEDGDYVIDGCLSDYI